MDTVGDGGVVGISFGAGEGGVGLVIVILTMGRRGWTGGGEGGRILWLSASRGADGTMEGGEIESQIDSLVMVRFETLSASQPRQDASQTCQGEGRTSVSVG